MLVIGITGPSTSGKTTLSSLCKIHYLADTVHQDKYFDEKKIAKKLDDNWETPEGIIWDEFEK